MRLEILGDCIYALTSQIGYIGIVVDYVDFYIAAKIELTQQQIQVNAIPQNPLR